MIIAVFIMIIGYSIFNTNLNIDGTANISSSVGLTYTSAKHLLAVSKINKIVLIEK